MTHFNVLNTNISSTIEKAWEPLLEHSQIGQGSITRGFGEERLSNLLRFSSDGKEAPRVNRGLDKIGGRTGDQFLYTTTGAEGRIDHVSADKNPNIPNSGASELIPARGSALEKGVKILGGDGKDQLYIDFETFNSEKVTIGTDIEYAHILTQNDAQRALAHLMVSYVDKQRLEALRNSHATKPLREDYGSITVKSETGQLLTGVTLPTVPKGLDLDPNDLVHIHIQAQGGPAELRFSVPYTPDEILAAVKTGTEAQLVGKPLDLSQNIRTNTLAEYENVAQIEADIQAIGEADGDLGRKKRVLERIIKTVEDAAILPLNQKQNWSLLLSAGGVDATNIVIPASVLAGRDRGIYLQVSTFSEIHNPETDSPAQFEITVDLLSPNEE